MVIKGSLWIKSEVQRAFDESKCVKKQSPKFYALLNKQLLEECDWCPFENNGCDECGGLKEILIHQCYSCNKCGIWNE